VSAKIWVRNWKPGANPTIVSYNASVVQVFNATSSLGHFENKNISSTLKKRSSLLQRWRCSWKLKCRRIGSRSKIWLPFIWPLISLSVRCPCPGHLCLKRNYLFSDIFPRFYVPSQRVIILNKNDNAWDADQRQSDFLQSGPALKTNLIWPKLTSSKLSFVQIASFRSRTFPAEMLV
jgi:hypothetical protein